MLAVGLFKFVRHINRIEERFNILWLAMFGTGLSDNDSWFHRLAIMETQVKELWESHVNKKRREDRYPYDSNF